MKPQSAKAKGRRCQQKIVSDLYETFPELGEGDIRSTSMGASGEDILMSAAARKLIPFSLEAKNQEKLNFWGAYEQCKSNCGEYAPAVVIKRNHSEMLCLLQWTKFLELVRGMKTTTLSPLSEECSLPEQLRRIATELEEKMQTDQ